MPADEKPPEGFTLKRWSRRKLEAAREAMPAKPAPPRPPDATSDGNPPIADSAPVRGSGPPRPSEPVLPPVESLTLDSDFTVFLQPKVDESLKRQALKKLFSDPRFNVMDGLDVYIDDYTKFDPIPPDVLERLMKAQFSWTPAAADDSSEPRSTTASNEPVETPAVAPVEPAISPAPEAPQEASPAADDPEPTRPR